MKKYFILNLIILSVFSSCTEEETNPVEENSCPPIACTQEYRSVDVNFKNAQGKLINVQDLKIKNLRTNKFLLSQPPNIDFVVGHYWVASDSQVKEFSEKGDTVLVSALDTVSNKSKEAKFVISGGKCACHIGKLAGPEEIIFD